MRISVYMALIGMACIGGGCAKPNAIESIIPSTGGYNAIARYGTPGYGQDVVIDDTIAYVAEGEGGLVIASIADRAHPRVLSICQDGVRGYSYKIAKRDSIIYVAASTYGVNVVDVGNPLNPVAIASNLSIKPSRSFLVYRNYLFTSISESGIKISEISTPSQVDIRGGFQTPGYAHGMAVSPDSGHLLVACGEMGLSLFDIRDMAEGFGNYPQVGWVDVPGYANDVATMGNRPVAFLACGTSGLQVVDYSDTANVHIIGSYSTGGYAKEVAYSNNRVYVTTELRGLQVFSVVNPAAPELVGTVETKYAMGVALDQHYVYVADEVEGLIIITIPPY